MMYKKLFTRLSGHFRGVKDGDSDCDFVSVEAYNNRNLVDGNDAGDGQGVDVENRGNAQGPNGGPAAIVVAPFGKLQADPSANPLENYRKRINSSSAAVAPPVPAILSQIQPMVSSPSPSRSSRLGRF